MPATMFTVIQTVSGSGKPKRHVVTLPRIDALLDEPLKYLVLPDEPTPPPAAAEPSERQRRRLIERAR